VEYSLAYQPCVEKVTIPSMALSAIKSIKGGTNSIHPIMSETKTRIPTTVVRAWHRINVLLTIEYDESDWAGCVLDKWFTISQTWLSLWRNST